MKISEVAAIHRSLLRLFAIVFALLLVLPAVGLSEQPIPSLAARVTDLTGTLSSQDRESLETRLGSIEKDRGSQIVVLIVATTAPEAIEQYSMRVVEAWKVGRQKVDDGVLLLIAKEDRALRIEVGYGLEGAINDAVSKRIIDEIIVPRFKEGDFYGGVNAGIGALESLIAGEGLPPAPESRPVPEGDLPIVLFIAAVVCGKFLNAFLHRAQASLGTGVLVFIVAMFFVSLLWAVAAGVGAALLTLLPDGSGSRYYGHSSGGWSSGGRGGFSGGGGSFGGGGASGRW